MPTKADDLKQRLAEVLENLRDEGTKDPEAMRMLGGITAEIVATRSVSSWRAYKSTLTAADFDALLLDIQSHGNQLVAEGQGRQAYALQALGLSLAASTQADSAIRAGRDLLDDVIDAAVALYQQSFKDAPKH